MKQISLLIIILLSSVQLLSGQSIEGQSSSKSFDIKAERPESQYRGNADPLKGLGVGDEIKEIEIGTVYALIIGIDDYKEGWQDLNNAVADAKAVQKVLNEKYKVDQFITLFDHEATRVNIISKFEWLLMNVGPTDNLFIFYSGHGEYLEALDKGYWVPADATGKSTAQYISNSDIQTFLGGINSKHTLLISDACFSGDIFRGNTETIPFEESNRYYQQVNKLPSRKAITSGGIEPVMDGGRDGHSVFTYYLLKTLESNNSKLLDASQLYEYLKIPVINNSEQTPSFAPIKNSGDEGGQFLFILK